MLPNNTNLITSIPPPLLKKGGHSIDDEKHRWQSLCLQSWINSGHDVFSINSTDEIVLLKEIFPNVNFIPAFRSTHDVNSRHLIYISDALNSIKLLPAKRIAICNADVLISESINGAILINDPDFCYSNRIDIESTESRAGDIFYGIDYFNMSEKFVNSLPETLFAFGLPWWDYWLPVHALSTGLTIHKLLNEQLSPILLHKKHNNAWNPSELSILGQYFFSLAWNTTETQNNISLVEMFHNFNAASNNQNQLQLHIFLAQSISSYINFHSAPLIV
ncbi:hypothetical protein [Polynucleobacter sp. AP-Kaivos-20-H2]|uniref:hypothetical protein n=1 Tax=Polynucleobacter sp. AP-Kaivos-20-H2 TaxID=2689104 RepID=UPI001C0E8A07|nr:hypothetical protein [Polynucleobacter sp. AP-Kaivos-20-H2]MBU3603374.1 hypothetical protein [Polynucleobacter sp. AP-Kaivos-20-H2]